MKKVDFSPYVELFWLEDVKAVQVKWGQLHLSLDKFKEITDTILEMISIKVAFGS
jgi:hypothetical protein